MVEVQCCGNAALVLGGRHSPLRLRSDNYLHIGKNWDIGSLLHCYYHRVDNADVQAGPHRWGGCCGLDGDGRGDSSDIEGPALGGPAYGVPVLGGPVDGSVLGGPDDHSSDVEDPDHVEDLHNLFREPL